MLRALRAFDLSGLAGDDCIGLVRVLARVEKACAAAKVRAALRVAECGSHRREGYTDPEDWLSRETGTSRGEARDALNTAASVTELPGTKRALDQETSRWRRPKRSRRPSV